VNSAFDTNRRYVDRIFYVGIYLSPSVRCRGERKENAYDIGEVRESRLVFTPQLASNTVLVVGHVLVFQNIEEYATRYGSRDVKNSASRNLHCIKSKMLRPGLTGPCLPRMLIKEPLLSPQTMRSFLV
jgi:hypothetical protein